MRLGVLVIGRSQEPEFQSGMHEKRLHYPILLRFQCDGVSAKLELKIPIDFNSPGG